MTRTPLAEIGVPLLGADGVVQRGRETRTVPAEFARRCKALCGSDAYWEWNATVKRWCFWSRSVDGKLCPQFFGWFYDQNTGANLQPDPATGLYPFRDLDASGQEYILRSLEKTYLGNPYDGAGTWKEQARRALEHNTSVSDARRKEDANLYADMLNEVDLRRPYLKFHSGPERARRVAYRQ